MSTTLKQRQLTQTYKWLLTRYDHGGNKWPENFDLMWQEYLSAFPNGACTREEFDKIVKEMKEDEGWV